jgi:periplasmic divalent cation tolerance protein
MSDLVLVLTTMPDDTRADEVARTLVDERLAACVNVSSPIVSTYRWNGTIETSAERQLTMKATRAQLPALEARLTSLHPYELPEWIVLDAGASRAYAAWVSGAAGG